jgi:hypothetical protein
VAEFPACSGNGVLQAMSVERPVVAMKWGDDADHALAATFVGSECTISGRDTAAYIERVSKIIREPAYRAKLGKTMRQRVEQYFGYNQTARSIEQICDQLIQRRSESATEGQTATPTAQAAWARPPSLLRSDPGDTHRRGRCIFCRCGRSGDRCDGDPLLRRSRHPVLRELF